MIAKSDRISTKYDANIPLAKPGETTIVESVEASYGRHFGTINAERSVIFVASEPRVAAMTQSIEQLCGTNRVVRYLTRYPS
jgi:hypothetical protein